jgi:DNA polymerase III alpha subunit/transcriptional regulator with XRE-family HTH domain
MFTSLHNHTQRSLLQSTATYKQLLTRAKELGQDAIAITDTGTMASTWEAFVFAKSIGIKLIMGCELYFRHNLKDNTERFKHIILLATNQIGYRNLLTLHAQGFDTIEQLGKKTYSVVDYEMLEKYNEGLIFLTGSGNGILGQLLMRPKTAADYHTLIEENVLRLRSIFGLRLGFEIQTNSIRKRENNFNLGYDQRFINHQMIRLGKEYDVKVVATCNTHYIYKEDSDKHDKLLCVASGQPYYSNFRMKYDQHEFYLKSEQEVVEYLSRYYPEAQEFVDNTQFFSSMCEQPIWIDPKHTNPSGKELPDFPVKDQKDYPEFLSWLPTQSDVVKNLQEDQKYLRYKCYANFDKYLVEGKCKSATSEEYIARIEEELDIISYREFDSYMLVVADFLEYARSLGDFTTGPGRGCLDGDTQVFTEKGFKNLKDIKIGENVYTHTGDLKKVINTFKYDVDEEGIEIKTRYSFKTIKMTKDHKVFASKTIDAEPSWIKASDLTLDHFIWMPFPKRKEIKIWDESNQKLPTIDLSNYVYGDEAVTDSHVVQSIPLKNEFSLRKIHRETGISRNALRDWIRNIGKTTPNILFRISKYLEKYNITPDELKSLDNVYKKTIKRFLPIDNEFYYFLGRWVGDGWIRTKKTNGYAYSGGLAFNSNDISGIDLIFDYLHNLGLDPKKHKHNTKKLIQIIFTGYVFYNLLRQNFPNYKMKSGTKSLPSIFRNIKKEDLKILLTGYYDSDGSTETKANRECFDTTSKSLMLELKEALLYLGIPSSVMVRKPYLRGEYACNESYKIRFSGFETNHNPEHVKNIKGDGYYCKIISLKPCKLTKVYDISVKDNLSYLTSNFAVHNSVGGSFVAYLLGIHTADPFKYDLIFARFQNREKASLPDIDSDFSGNVRERVIQYLYNKYGSDCVAHVSNFNHITPKVWARDICRVLELGGDKKSAVELGNKIADSIPADMKSVKQAYEESPLFNGFCEQFPNLKKYFDLDGQWRAASTHAAGIIVSKRPLIGLVPYRKDLEGNASVEYEKNTAEENGLVKIDILGLKTLDIIQDTYALIEAMGKTKPIFDYESYDKPSYDLISSGKTFGVFQLGTSGGTMDLCRKIEPKEIEEISQVNSLARPSSKEIRQAFVLAKEGKKSINLIHPKLERSLGKTLGFSLYEESLMFLALDVAGWTLNEADILRKMTKEKSKDPEKAKKIARKFIDGAIHNGIKEETAEAIWHMVEGYSKYGFNKSHSILYSMTSYHTAYLKAHYPVEFLLANLLSELCSTALNSEQNIAKLKDEIRNNGIEILKPSINDSEYNYKIVQGNKLLTGFSAMKSLQEKAIADISAKRPFHNFFDFMRRVDASKVQSNTIQALIGCGCFDGFGLSRKAMYLHCQDYRKKLQSWLKRHNPETEQFVYAFPEDDWTIQEKYALEVYYMGEGFICSQTEAYLPFYKKSRTKTVKELLDLETKHPIDQMRAIIKDQFTFKIKKEGSSMLGQEMAKLTMIDINGDRFSATIFPTALEKIRKRGALEKDVALYFSGNVNIYNEEFGIVIEDVFEMYPPPPLPLDRKTKLSLKKDKEIKEPIKDPNEDEASFALHTEQSFVDPEMEFFEPLPEDRDDGDFQFPEYD